MSADPAPTATTAAEPRDADGLPPVRAATSADAEAITRMRSAYVLSAPFTEDWVIQPFPRNPDGGVQPPGDVGDELITLVSCAEIFHTDLRSVVFGHLVETVPVER